MNTLYFYQYNACTKYIYIYIYIYKFTCFSKYFCKQSPYIILQGFKFDSVIYKSFYIRANKAVSWFWAPSATKFLPGQCFFLTIVSLQQVATEPFYSVYQSLRGRKSIPNKAPFANEVVKCCPFLLVWRCAVK